MRCPDATVTQVAEPPVLRADRQQLQGVPELVRHGQHVPPGAGVEVITD